MHDTNYITYLPDATITISLSKLFPFLFFFILLFHTDIHTSLLLWSEFQTQYQNNVLTIEYRNIAFGRCTYQDQVSIHVLNL